jgi:hypothetical protein
LIMSFEFLIPTCKKTNHTKSLLMSFEFWARLEAQCNQIGEYYCKKPPHCNDEETWAMFISFLSFMQNPIPLCVCVCVWEEGGEREREREREHLLSYNRIHTAFCFLTIRCFLIKDMWLN